MPTPLHNSIQLAVQDILKRMLVTKFLSLNQYMKLGVEVGTSEFPTHLPKPFVLIIDVTTAYSSFIGKYAGESKEADLELKVDGRPKVPSIPAFCPVWVNETGWSESRPALDCDITKWLVGTGHGVRVAIQTKFTPRANGRVGGFVIFHANNGNTTNRKASTLGHYI
jgi:hypothetical protein